MVPYLFNTGRMLNVVLACQLFSQHSVVVILRENGVWDIGNSQGELRIKTRTYEGTLKRAFRLDVKNDEDLERAQVIISEFLVRNVPIHAHLMEVAVNEAMNNSFFACGRVSVKTRRMGGKVIIRIKDNCRGFNTDKVNVQLKKEMYEKEFEEMLEAEGGRGILLMKLICDKVIYNSRGNEVLLMKKTY